MYVCNCNGLHERQVRSAIEAGASDPSEIFEACGTQVNCARCVCDMHRLLEENGRSAQFAAE